MVDGKTMFVISSGARNLLYLNYSCVEFAGIPEKSEVKGVRSFNALQKILLSNISRISTHAFRFTSSVSRLPIEPIMPMVMNSSGCSFPTLEIPLSVRDDNHRRQESEGRIANSKGISSRICQSTGYRLTVLPSMHNISLKIINSGNDATPNEGFVLTTSYDSTGTLAGE